MPAPSCPGARPPPPASPAARALVAALLLSPLLPAQGGPPNDYVCAWTFDEGQGAVLNDSGPHGFHGDIYGAAWTTGAIGGALEFNGTSDYVEITDGNGYPDPIGDLTQGTISVWFRFDNTPGPNQIHPMAYLGDGVGGATNSSLILEVGHFSYDTQAYYTVVTDNAFIPQCFDSMINLRQDEWHHFVAVTGPGYNTGYINGVELVNRFYNFGTAEDDYFFDDIVNKAVMWLGRGFLYSVPREQWYDGAIDELMIWDRPLSAQEVRDYYESVMGPTFDVEITAPAHGDAVSGVVSIDGVSTRIDPAGGAVDVSIDGGDFLPATGVSPWSYSWDTSGLADGWRHIRVRAVSSMNDPAVFTSAEVYVDNTGVGTLVEISSPADGDVVWGPTTVSGNSVHASAVSVSVDGGPFLPATGLGFWSFDFDASTLSHSHHQITARADDGQGGWVETTSHVIANPESPPPPTAHDLVPGSPVAGGNALAPPRLDFGAAGTVYVEIFGHSENRGYADELQALLDADAPNGLQYVVSNHWIAGHELWQWVTPGTPGYQAIDNLLANLQGPTVALLLVSNNATHPIGAPDLADPNYARFVNECGQLADHLYAGGAGVQAVYFSAHRMKPANLMPCWYENLAVAEVMADAEAIGRAFVRPGPEQHKLHWDQYPEAYDVDFAHTSQVGDELMAAAWHGVLKKDLNGSFDLSASAVVHDSVASFTVTGAAADRWTYLTYGLGGLGSTPVPQLHLVSDLLDPVLAGNARKTDAAGATTWALPSPRNIAGWHLWLQALQNYQKSNAIEVIVQ